MLRLRSSKLSTSLSQLDSMSTLLSTSGALSREVLVLNQQKTVVSFTSYSTYCNQPSEKIVVETAILLSFSGVFGSLFTPESDSHFIPLLDIQFFNADFYSLFIPNRSKG